LRRRLEEAGIGKKVIADIFEQNDLDLGLDEESGPARPSVALGAFGRDRGGSR